ncbi:hypothetical protein TSUD_68990 [Trifolium subterraneum]|uniref:Wall-associated receptor kinase galacturonan-binding domain-containing protein n=1 Tax=Trifolium subterraneum TaxID=3900 RepID=A0A2Z6N838_TRISU|nr:hypothetical protein TSUD_68990 [Trifolium subterraneum]
MVMWGVGLIIFAAFVVWIFIITIEGGCFITSVHCGTMFNESLFDSFDSFGEECVNPSFQVICENNKSVIYFNYGERQANAILVSNLSSTSFRYIITGVSPDNNCLILNSFSLPYENVSFFSDPYVYESIMVMRCKKPVEDPYYYESISSEGCGGGIDGEEKQFYSYVMEIDGEESLSVTHIAESCRIEMKVMISSWQDGKVKCNDKRKCGYPEEVHTEYLNGIEFPWRPIRCGKLNLS